MFLLCLFSILDTDFSSRQQHTQTFVTWEGRKEDPAMHACALCWNLSWAALFLEKRGLWWFWGGGGLMVFICLCRLHRQQAWKLVCTHNKLDIWETVGLGCQVLKRQHGDTKVQLSSPLNNPFCHQVSCSFCKWLGAIRLGASGLGQFRFFSKGGSSSLKVAVRNNTYNRPGVCKRLDAPLITRCHRNLTKKSIS